MASQPITAAHRQPLRWLGFDQGVFLVTIGLISHWSGQTAAALAFAAMGTGLMGHAGFRTMRSAAAARSGTSPAADAEQISIRG
ncbi:MAG: hypothetical protein H7338_03515 [Candidatus Sericytochromatia bacterium]|nr:hypothetical protein [Candidatus Sericytochromatia bacterium]